MKNNKLPSEFKKKWVAALKSGKYIKGQGVLKQENNRYCCLGVACEILGVTNILDETVIARGRGLKGINKVPKLITGTDVRNPIVKELIKMNDEKDYSFEKIADYIEENL